MRTFVMSSVAGAILIASAGCADSAAVETNKTADIQAEKVAAEQTEEQDGKAEMREAAIGAYPEGDILDEQVTMDHYQLQVVEDNPGVRVMFLSDENGQRQFKSVFQKDSHILKVIDLDQGLIFKGTIG
ncbi:hypothetical protein [Lentibacillus juripiscarius]|uniref:Lipoprotein n=1 Tax=Lentibacillus juripiscarius TaxID=257446 RepID=A0ABW5V7G9_9BACI